MEEGTLGTLFDADAVRERHHEAVEAAHAKLDEYGVAREVGEGTVLVLSLAARVMLLPDPPEMSDLAAQKLGPFARESETSRLAALAAYPRQGSQRRRIIEAFRTGRGMIRGFTREELAASLGMPDNSVRPRVRELIEGGWIGQGVKDGKPATRPTRTGQESEVLVLTKRAMAKLAAG